MGQDNDNGKSGNDANISTLTLKLDRATFNLTVGGKTKNLDEAIAMVDMAKRALTKQLAAQELAQAMNAPQIADGMPRMPPIFGRRG